MNRVSVYSREMVDRVGFDKENLVLISICSTFTPRTRNLDGWKDMLLLTFDDATPDNLTPNSLMPIPDDFDAPLLFDHDLAKQVVDFVKTHEGTNFVVHCDAGISRSVAVGRFIADFFDYSPVYHVTRTDRFANIFVYNTLRREITENEF